MSIGTAAPTLDELSQAKHYFIHNKSILDDYSVGSFEKEALKTLDNLFKSKVFGETISTLINNEIEIYETTGAIGASRAVNLRNKDFVKFGKNIIDSDLLKTFTPQLNSTEYKKAFNLWVKKLELTLK